MTQRRKTALLGMILLLASQCLAQTEAEEKKAIEEIIQKSYIDAAYNYVDVDAIKKGFHESYTSLSKAHGHINVINLKQWLLLLKRQKIIKADMNTGTSAKIDTLQVEGDAAVARVDVYRDGVHNATEFLSLYKLAEGWKITNKISNDHPIPPEIQLKRRGEWERAMTFNLQPPDKVMDAIGLKPGMTVGEIGAGFGRYTVHLAARVGDNGKIYANDINKTALSTLEERCEKEGIRNVEAILGENEDPLFPKNSLDMAFMVWVFHGLDKPSPLFRNLIPALKPGAPLVIVDPVDSEIDLEREFAGEEIPPDRPTIKQRVETAAEEAGFELVKVEDFLPLDYIFILTVKDRGEGN